VATVVSLLAHVPPVVGDKVVVAPTHIVLGPVKLTTEQCSMMLISQVSKKLPKGGYGVSCAIDSKIVS
jgi:hypothetical protein